MASILEFPRVPAFSQNFALARSTQPAVALAYAARKARILAQTNTQTELQISNTVARNDREIARLVSIDQLNSLQRLFASAPTSRSTR